MLNFNVSVLLNNNTLFVAIEITFSHVSNLGFTLFVPRLHRMRVLPSVHFDGISDTPI